MDSVYLKIHTCGPCQYLIQVQRKRSPFQGFLFFKALFLSDTHTHKKKKWQKDHMTNEQ